MSHRQIELTTSANKHTELTDKHAKLHMHIVGQTEHANMHAESKPNRPNSKLSMPTGNMSKMTNKCHHMSSGKLNGKHTWVIGR
jgi:hypothetical protein